jgi:hypothetical protein
MAESKIFDLPGIDSIDSAKISLAYKVLTYASEKRDLSIATNEAYKS